MIFLLIQQSQEQWTGSHGLLIEEIKGTNEGRQVTQVISIKHFWWPAAERERERESPFCSLQIRQRREREREKERQINRTEVEQPVVCKEADIHSDRQLYTKQERELIGQL